MFVLGNKSNPQPQGLVERPRLLQKLHLVTGYKLTLISAPPGYGKTTLASQFMQGCDLPVAWHTVDASQRDVPLLHYNALSVLETLTPGISELQAVYGYPPIELATQITDYTRHYLAEDAIYVLDDVHHLTGSLPAETWLRALVERLPARMHVIMISRILPDLPLTEMIARREILAIGQEELKFRRDEIYALAAHMLDEPPTPEQVENWAVRLEGWPAGTVLAIHPLPKDLERAMLRGGAGPEALFQNLANSMLLAQPPNVRDFLLASSTLTRLTPQLCSQALGLPDSEILLAEVLNKNMFLARVTGGLAYHTLFRELLQEQLWTNDSEQFFKLHRQAAEWFADNDHVVEAVDHFITAGELKYASELADRVAYTFYIQGNVETLFYWAASLESVKFDSPRLLLYCAKLHINRYEYDMGAHRLHEAKQGFELQNDQPGCLEVRSMQAWISFFRNNYDEAINQANTILEDAPHDSAVYGDALSLLGVIHMDMGDIEAAVRHLEAAQPILRADGDAYNLSLVLQRLQVAYAKLGRLDNSGACLQEIVALRRDLGNATFLALALNNLAVHYHGHSNYKDAMATIQEGLSVAAKVPNNRAESVLLWSKADIQRDRGAYNEAQDLYNKALELLGEHDLVLRAEIFISAAKLARWQKRYHEAISLATEAAIIAEQNNLGLTKLSAQLASLAARGEQGEAAQVLPKIDAIIDNIQSIGAELELLQALGVGTHTALLAADHTRAARYFEQALRAARNLKTAQPLAVEACHAPGLRNMIDTKQTSHDILVQDLKLLERARYKLSETRLKTGEDGYIPDTYLLNVLTLGRDTVERDGVVLTTSDWRANAAREMFYYLLFNGPISREQINLAFWPDISPEKARARFHTTLYRARQALGENFIVFQDDMYQLNPITEVWCDAQELEKLTTQARLLSPRDARTEDLWRKATRLYKGEFLSSLEADWVYLRREILHEAYIEAMIGLGQCARTRGDFRAALNAYREALIEEPYREDINRAIMICYADLGENHQILTHLNELRERLLRDLAVEPSSETIELANRLLA